MGRKRENYNAYMREYMLARYHRRRKEALDRLGNKCKKCGSVKNLQFDHIDPKKKTFPIWGRTLSEIRLEKELSKCQLLCGECHDLKTIKEKGNKPAKGTHGTLSAYRYCGPPKCDACKKAKTEWMRGYYKIKPRYKYLHRKPKFP